MTVTGADIRRMSNSLLLIALLILLVVEPFVTQQTSTRVAFDVAVSVVLVVAIWAVARRRDLLVIGLLLGAPAFVARWAEYVVDTQWLAGLWPLLTIAFFTFTVIVLLRQVIHDTTVTLDTIAGAICAYLLLSAIWALVFLLIELSHPGSFQVNGHPFDAPLLIGGSRVPDFIYLSLITLSTVGYGDIVPVTRPARMLAALEGVIGQLYLAVLIARLIGLHASRRSRSGV